MKKSKAIAVITIRGASEMTPEGRIEIAKWLRRHANFLIKNGTNYASRYTARYLTNG